MDEQLCHHKKGPVWSGQAAAVTVHLALTLHTLRSSRRHEYVVRLRARLIHGEPGGD